MYNPEVETATRAEMERLQVTRLKKTISHVYENVPYYREKFEELGLNPEDIQQLSDITKLPFTKKQVLRDQYPFGLFAVPMEDVTRIHGSSGTSGKPTIVGYTKNDLENWATIVARGIVAAGGRKSDIFHNAYGYGLFTGGLGLHYGAEQLGVATVPISGGNTDRQITIINDFKPRGICGTPSYILNIAEKMEEMGIDPADNGLEYGIFGAEPWSEEMRATLEKKLNLKAVDIYGLSEIMGPGVAIECHEAQDGLHIAEDHFLVEVINPDTLEPVEDGEDGELVFTSLTKEALPIIRYRTGDIASITHEQCRCGRTTTRMSRVKGRTDDMIIVRGVNVFPSEIERVLFQMEGIVPHYQIHLIKKGNMDSVELHIEIESGFYKGIDGDLTHENVQKLKKAIQHHMKSTCLVTMDIVVNIPKSIPRSEGKAIRVVDKRKDAVINA
ncbi:MULTISPECIES: phenylacetate--CoA ligase PaaK [Peribacillus]|uniref:phenylacetate--CoA ligase PaaK n=1 Tax=Peribacillus TaxID=2675229 RepID=UPI0019141100|nr:MULTISPECIES: phenylacetate--CoA ligase PaaK [unclassified Peribacillus]MBK5460018.1 phenylacetate--CoA ligase [Peribacillus sp. TH27]MBK5481831.1 phenylacetate--CoA ligase [Peribacillus sp. TH16]MBK5498209.1 phenylacetate--CoA ligase [Peribacillus sp. TH14]WMX56671.1 phenylacetate--CoA ligase PaaK [Peribacillus sp. R9-11]